MSGATKLVNISDLFKDLGWHTLETRRRHHRLIFLHKMSNALVPSYLIDLLPDVNATAPRVHTRNNNIHTTLCRTNNYYNSFLPRTIREWNKLPPSQKQLNLSNSNKKL